MLCYFMSASVIYDQAIATPYGALTVKMSGSKLAYGLSTGSTYSG